MPDKLMSIDGQLCCRTTFIVPVHPCNSLIPSSKHPKTASNVDTQHFKERLVPLLAWRPEELPATEQMYMQVIYGLTAVCACVDHDAKAVV